MAKHKKPLAFVSCSLVALSMAFCSPYLVETAYVGSFVTAQLTEGLGMPVDPRQTSWSWLPVPHISLADTSVSGERLSATVPRARLYPDWAGLLVGSLGVKRIELDSPEIRVKPLRSPDTTDHESPAIPPMVVMKGCRLFLPAMAATEEPEDPAPLLELSNIDAAIHQGRTGVDIDIAWRPEFAESLSIRGRYLPPHLDSDAATVAEPRLRLHSEGTGIDLAQVREKVLLLLGDNEKAQRVFSIIRGGHARKAGFFFEGEPRDIGKLELMTITADADGAAIDIPKLNLHIRDGSGPIRVQDGILYGRNLTARLGNSSGTNGTIALGLLGRGRIFKLEVDIDADMSDLPGVLHNVIRSESFRSELAAFTNARGLAKARLVLGDKLKDVSAEVVLSDTETYVDYRRLLFPIRLKEAHVRIAPMSKTIAWQGVKGSVGPHRIYHSTGTAGWKDHVSIGIEEHRSTMDSHELLRELALHPELGLQKALSKVLLSVGGPLEIEDLELQGMATDPANWRYRTSVSVKDLRFVSPYFLEAVHVESASILASQGNIDILQSLVTLSDQPISFKGALDHTGWQNWRGQLALEGVVSQAEAKWLKSKGWIPPPYFPQIPCRLSPLHVSFTGKSTVDIRGRIISEKHTDRPVQADIAFTKSPEAITLEDLTIVASGEEASLSLRSSRSRDEDIALGFAGSLKGDTLSSILEENRLLRGHIRGAFDLKYAQDVPNPSLMRGRLEVADYNWDAGKGRQITIHRADIEGHGSEADIHGVSLSLNEEPLTGSGRIVATGSGVDLDLDLKSDGLSWTNLSRLLGSGTTGPTDENTTPAPQAHTQNRLPDFLTATPKTSDLAITGSIDFAVKEFKCAKVPRPQNAADADEEPGDYIWHSVAGSVNLLPDGRISIPVSSAGICGFETTGAVELGPDHRSMSVSVESGEETSFREVFACLGIDYDKIEGPFTLDAQLEGMPGEWQTGRAELNAKEGRITGLTLLTRILSVVNVMDLFGKDAMQDFFSKGFFYSDIEVKGDIKDNILTLEEAEIRGNGMNLFASGEIDLDKMSIDGVVLVAPFKVLDTTLSKLLSLGFIKADEANAIITVPLGVKGPLEDPVVTPLPSQAVGESLANIVRNVLVLPFTVLTRGKGE